MPGNEKLPGGNRCCGFMGSGDVANIKVSYNGGLCEGTTGFGPFIARIFYALKIAGNGGLPGGHNCCSVMGSLDVAAT